MRCKILAFVLAAVLLLRGGMLAARAVETDGAVALSLEGEGDETGIKVTLHLSSDNGICGLFASLCYDSESVVLTSCGIGEGAESLVLSYNDNEGRVDFLLDGYENCAPCGALVSFYFTIKDSQTKSFDFSLELAQEISAACISEGGDVINVTPDASGCATTVFCDAPSTQDPPSTLVGIHAKRENGKMKIVLTARSAPSLLAIGFKLFAVDTVTARTQTVLVVAVTDGDTVNLCAELTDISGGVCVIVTPTIYSGRTVSEGQKSIYVFW